MPKVLPWFLFGFCIIISACGTSPEDNDGTTVCVSDCETLPDPCEGKACTDLPPTVAIVAPAADANGVAIDASITLRFSEAVILHGAWFEIRCSVSGTRGVANTAVRGDGLERELIPKTPFAQGEQCTLRVYAAQVADVDEIDPPDLMESDYVVAFTVVDLAPWVTLASPATGTVDVALDASLVLHFSEPVALNGAWFEFLCSESGARGVTDVTVTASGDGLERMLTPNRPFLQGERCTFRVHAAQVADLDGNYPPDVLEADFVLSFVVVDLAPWVAMTSPATGDVGVALDASLVLHFSEPVSVSGAWFDFVCSESGARGVTDVTVSGNEGERVLISNTPFVYGEQCTVRVHAMQIADLDGNEPRDAMAADFVVTFIMVDIAPSVILASPATDAVDVAHNASITLRFSEEVTVSGEWFALECSVSGARGVTGFSVSVDGAEYTLTPIVPYGLDDRCTLRVHAELVAEAYPGAIVDTMASDFVVTFQTVTEVELLNEGFGAGMPAGWKLFNVDGRTPNTAVYYVNQAWIVREDFKFNTQNQVAFSTSWYSPEGQADDWMMTRALSLPSGGTCTLHWKAVTYDPAYPDGYEVRISTTEATPSGGLANPALVTIAAENAVWTERSVNLAAYAGNTVSLAFRNVSNDKFQLLVDDIRVACER